MAATNRTGELSEMNNNIYDNNAKEIDPAMVRAVITSLIESNFNLIDDILKDLNYDTGVTLQEVISPPLWGATGYFNVGTTSGSLTGNEGIVSSVTASAISNGDGTQLTVTLNESIADRRLLLQVYTNSTNTDANNDIGTPVYRVVTNTNIVIGLAEFSGETQSIRIEIFAFKI